MIFQFINDKIANRSASLFRGALIVSTAIFATPNTALSQDARFAGEYYCVETASGGVIYDDQLKDWRGANFRPSEGRMLVKVTAKGEFTDSSTGKLTMGYQVQVSSPGESTYTCQGTFIDRPIELGDSGLAFCTTFLFDYRFNFKELRYLEIYPRGFYYGEDDIGDSPHIAVGKCSKF